MGEPLGLQGCVNDERYIIPHVSHWNGHAQAVYICQRTFVEMVTKAVYANVGKLMWENFEGLAGQCSAWTLFDGDTNKLSTLDMNNQTSLRAVLMLYLILN